MGNILTMWSNHAFGICYLFNIWSNSKSLSWFFSDRSRSPWWNSLISECIDINCWNYCFRCCHCYFSGLSLPCWYDCLFISKSNCLRDLSDSSCLCNSDWRISPWRSNSFSKCLDSNIWSLSDGLCLDFINSSFLIMGMDSLCVSFHNSYWSNCFSSW
jgi:hypothetical protein